MVNGHLSCNLYWNQKKITETVPFDDITITLSFHTAPGYFHYQAFTSTFEALEACHIPHDETMILLDMIQYQRKQDYEFIAEEKLPWGSE